MASVARRSVVAGLAALAAPGVTSRAFAAGAAAYPALQAMLDGYVAAKKLPGGVVAVSRRGRAADYVAAGTLAFDTDARAAPDSIYRVYSMTKPIVGVAVMMLIEQGKLRLDQPLADILPAFRDMRVVVDGDVTKTRPAAGPILIRHLVTHTSGLSYGIDAGSPLAAVYRQQGFSAGGRTTTARPGELAPARNLGRGNCPL